MSFTRRHPRLREGYVSLEPQERKQVRTAQMDVEISVLPKMSGGPLIVHRPYPDDSTPVLVGLINAEMQTTVKKSDEDPNQPERAYATPSVFLWTHEIHLPDTDEWIPFFEAVARGIIKVTGEDERHVRFGGGRFFVDHTDTQGVLPTMRALGLG
jgi:hypothetical protein